MSTSHKEKIIRVLQLFQTTDEKTPMNAVQISQKLEEEYGMENVHRTSIYDDVRLLQSCGSGRDTKYFLEQGCKVTAIDGSQELCKLASEYTGIPVKHMLFQNLDEKEAYDGIWACSSILHVPANELRDIIKKMANALRAHGIIYTSFKYGTFEGKRNGRYFTDMTEETFAKLIQDMDELKIEEQWITSDVRPGRGEEKWLNLILRKE